MPIVIKEFEATQTEQELFITVALNGANAAKVDVHATDIYIKINFPPFFFELDLAHSIDPDASVASVGNNTVTFKLVKVEPGVWSEIKFKAASPKQLRDRRKESEARNIAKTEAKRLEAVVAKRALERDAVRRQIEVEREKRERVEKLKLAEKESGEREIAEWARKTLEHEKQLKTVTQARSVESSTQANHKTSTDETAESVKPVDGVDNHAQTESLRVDSAIFGPEDIVAMDLEQPSSDDLDSPTNTVSLLRENDDDGIDVDAIRARVRAQLQKSKQSTPSYFQYCFLHPLSFAKTPLFMIKCNLSDSLCMGYLLRQNVENKAQEAVPQPRSSQDISVTFTPRGFIPTNTARETEDEKWRLRIKLAEEVKKAQDQKSKIATGNDDSKERHPAFLKDRGVQFFKQGNLQAAVNAFTGAIECDGADASLYANRAACYLQLADGQKCVADATASLCLIAKEEEIIREQLVSSDNEAGADQRRMLKSKLLARRAVAKSNLLADLRGGLEDMRAALQLDPLNAELRSDATSLAERLGVEL
eukprot:jgi/Hompol1/4527/HPOL_000940-RA